MLASLSHVLEPMISSFSLRLGVTNKQTFKSSPINCQFWAISKLGTSLPFSVEI